ncbi:hypothetical protein [Vitreimonas sp.]|uniref:hypothetical protein n=1 Tax=Vitreimonas sp. TaxID=3069702 RepID=UPI002ED9B945
MITNLALIAAAILYVVIGYAILAKNEALIRVLHLRVASQSPFMGLMGFVLAAFFVMALLARIGS